MVAFPTSLAHMNLFEQYNTILLFSKDIPKLYIFSIRLLQKTEIVLKTQEVGKLFEGTYKLIS